MYALLAYDQLQLGSQGALRGREARRRREADVGERKRQQREDTDDRTFSDPPPRRPPSVPQAVPCHAPALPLRAAREQVDRAQAARRQPAAGSTRGAASFFLASPRRDSLNSRKDHLVSRTPE